MPYIVVSAFATVVMTNSANAQDFIPAGANIQCTDERSTKECIPCKLNPNPLTERRRRYEVRDMPDGEWENFVTVVKEMAAVPMDEGIEKYGPLYKSFDYFTVFHSIGHTSLRGDQGHNGPWLLSFHGPLALMFEVTMLTVAKAMGLKLSGLPYFWNLGGPASTAEIFGPKYFGTHPGIGDDYRVSDGAFGDWQIVTNFDKNDWNILNVTDYTYESRDGIMRTPINPNKSPYYYSFPLGPPPNFGNDGDMDVGTGMDMDSAMGRSGGASSNPGDAPPNVGNMLGSVEEMSYPGYPYEDVIRCLHTPYDPQIFTIYNFTFCTDSFSGVGPALNSWHIGTHVGLGGVAHPSHSKYTQEMQGYQGDFLDLISGAHSPYFHPLHALLDMFLQEWKDINKDYKDETWGYPYEKATGWFNVDSYSGINADDVVNNAFPIRYMDVGLVGPDAPDAHKLLTHAEAHCLLTKENSPYVYVKYSASPDGAPGEVFDDEEPAEVNQDGSSGWALFATMGYMKFAGFCTIFAVSTGFV